MSARGLAVLDLKKRWPAEAKKAVKAVVSALTGGTPPKPRSRDAAKELERRAEINRQGAELRAERGRLLDALMGWGPRHWIAPRPDWLKPRDRSRGW